MEEPQMPTAVDHLEAALARVTREDIAALAPARRRSLQITLQSWAYLSSDILHRTPAVRPGSSAAEGVCPTCGESTTPREPTCADPMCKAEHRRYAAGSRAK
jgi:hypothetical protein